MADSSALAVQTRFAERAKAEISCLVDRFPALGEPLSPFAGTMPPFIVEPSGEGRVIDLVVGTGRYYGRDAQDVAASLTTEASSREANIVCRMPMPTAAHGRLQSICQSVLQASGFAKELPTRSDGWSAGRSRLLILAGAGLGHQVASIIDAVDPRYVVLYEPQPQLLYCASFTIPWRRLIERLCSKGRDLLVVSGQSVVASCQRIAQWLRGIPAINFDGARWVQHNEDPAFESLKAVIAEHVRMLNKAPGFFIDERRQFVHTLANLRRTDGVLAEKRPGTLAGDLIIVGSGPSLDEAIPLISRARERAIIFSCGTGMTPLLRAGILPDFHIELETSSGRYALASAVEDPAVFRSATLIASNGYYPPSFDLFERRLTFMRQGNFAAWVFRALGTVLDHGAPTVTNAAVALGHWLGFRRIFAFGVDLGYYDPAVQHSRKSLYFDEREARFHPSFAHLPGGASLRSFYPSSEIEVADNQGGRILTNDIFYRSLRAFDSFVHEEGVRLIHCGLGARIWGSEVRRMADLSETDFACDRPRTLAAIADRFSKVAVGERDLEQAVAAEQASLASLVKAIGGIVGERIGSFPDFLDRANTVSLRVRDTARTAEIGAQRLIGGEVEKLTVFAADLATSARDEAARARIWEGWRAGLDELGRHVQAEMATIVPGQGIDPVPGQLSA